MLVGTIVVTGDGTGADIGACADLGVAQISQVADLGARAQVRILQLDKVTHMRLGTQHAAWSQTCKRAGIAALTQNCAFDMAVGFDDDALAQGAVLDDAVRTDDHVILDHDLAFKNHIDIDQHVAPNAHFTAHIESRRVTQGHASRHQTTGFAHLVMTLQLGKLFAIIGTLHFHRVVRLLCGNHQTIVGCHGNHVGEVILALGIVVGQPPQPVSEMSGRHRENSGIAFGDSLLRVTRVLMLDDGTDTILIITNDTAITGRVIQRNGQQAQLLRVDQFEQARERFHFDQRYIAIKNQHGVSRQCGQRLSNRMTGTELLVLHHEIQVIGCQLFTHGISAVSNHDMYSTWG